MRTTVLLLVATAAVVTAQATYDEAAGLWHCAQSNASFCAGDSLRTDIIIRCNATGFGQPGRCSNNLSGQPPAGAKTALCYQPDANSGTAACEKNCVVYNGDGTTFALPPGLCTPAAPEPTTTITFVDPPFSHSTRLTQPPAGPTTAITYTNLSLPATEPGTTITYINPSIPAAPTTTITYINDWGALCTTTYWQPPTPALPTKPADTTTITYIDDWGVKCTTTLPQLPKTTLTTTYVNPTQPAATGSGNGGYSNGTCVTCHGSGGEGGKTPPNPTKVPDGAGPSGKGGPSTRPTGIITSGAGMNSIGGAAVLAMVAAYLL